MKQVEYSLAYYLDLWAQWMRSTSSFGTWYPNRAAVFGQSVTNYSVCEDDGDAYDMRRHQERMANVDALVRSLPHVQQQAIHDRFLDPVVTFPPIDLSAHLEPALNALDALMRARFPGFYVGL